MNFILKESQVNEQSIAQSVTSSSPLAQLQTTNVRNESNYTKLTVVCCVTYLVGNFIDCFTAIGFTFGFQFSSWAGGSFNIIGNVFFYFSHSVHFFIYYHYDKNFKTEFKKTIGLCLKR